jgi:hypothetical protein
MCEEAWILRCSMKTSMAVGKTARLSVLDALLFQRLMAWHGDDVAVDRDLPLPWDQDLGLWRCGGGYAETSERLSQRPVYKKTLGDASFLEMASTARGESVVDFGKWLGQRFGYSDPSGWMYPHLHAQEVLFRFVGTAEQAERVAWLMDPDQGMYIGPGHSVGMGEVAEVVVEPQGIDLADEPLWPYLDHNNRLTRPLPAATAVPVGAARSDWVILRPPYWSGTEVRGWRPYPQDR